MRTKGDISMNMIIMAIIALLVLAVIAFLIFDRGNTIDESEICENLGGVCTGAVDNRCPSGAGPRIPGVCSSPNDVCCRSLG